MLPSTWTLANVPKYPNIKPYKEIKDKILKEHAEIRIASTHWNERYLLDSFTVVTGVAYFAYIFSSGITTQALVCQ